MSWVCSASGKEVEAPQTVGAELAGVAGESPK
jgi:hypothetical protein